MTFVVSEGTVRSLDRAPSSIPPYRVRLTSDFTQDYAEIWRRQPAVRTVVSFLARNIASLGLHTFERVSDTDRKRLTDHPIAALLSRPNPRTTRYRLFDALVHDLGIYDTAYLLKMKAPALVRLPPERMKPVGESWLWADGFEFTGSKGKRTFGVDEIVHFRGFNPTDSRTGSSPIESLRATLAEDFEASRMREQTLRNGARVSGYLERPVGAPAWSPEARERFRRGWQSQYTGAGPQAGGTPILEDGMTFSAASQTAEQLQYIAARKLTREEVAAAYFIPPPMVGILDNATFSNITEQHKMLYQDTLGPWLSMITEEFGLQLLPDFAAGPSIYVEFNLSEKLRGSFEEQASQLQTSVGAPWLTRNEARARNNLPSIDGGDELVVPLNVLVGGQASPTDSAPKSLTLNLASGVKARAPQTYTTKTEQVLSRFFKHQRAVVLSALGAKAGEDWWDEKRWDSELADDLLALALVTAKQVSAEVLDSMGFDPSTYDEARTLNFLKAVAASRAGMVNATTRDQIKAALVADPADYAEGEAPTPARVFDVAESSRVPQAAAALVTTFSAFATTEAAHQVAPDRATKTWLVGSSNPRASHAAMNGETVGIDDAFSNGLSWPGDPSMGADEVAGCLCGVEVNIP